MMRSSSHTGHHRSTLINTLCRVDRDRMNNIKPKR